MSLSKTWFILTILFAWCECTHEPNRTRVCQSGWFAPSMGARETLSYTLWKNYILQKQIPFHNQCGDKQITLSPHFPFISFTWVRFGQIFGLFTHLPDKSIKPSKSPNFKQIFDQKESSDVYDSFNFLMNGVCWRCTQVAYYVADIPLIEDWLDIIIGSTGYCHWPIFFWGLRIVSPAHPYCRSISLALVHSVVSIHLILF